MKMAAETGTSEGARGRRRGGAIEKRRRSMYGREERGGEGGLGRDQRAQRG